MRKLVGYRYYLCETYPGERPDSHEFHRVLVRETLDDIMKIFEAIQASNILFESWTIEMIPIYQEEPPAPCNACGGSGKWTPYSDCHVCHGTGRQPS